MYRLQLEGFEMWIEAEAVCARQQSLFILLCVRISWGPHLKMHLQHMRF